MDHPLAAHFFGVRSARNVLLFKAYTAINRPNASAADRQIILKAVF
jgi:hypothetical protein